MLFGRNLGNGTIRNTTHTARPNREAFTVSLSTRVERAGGGTFMIGGMSAAVTLPQFCTIPATWPIPTTPTTRTGTTPVTNTQIYVHFHLHIGSPVNIMHCVLYHFQHVSCSLHQESHSVSLLLKLTCESVSSRYFKVFLPTIHHIDIMMQRTNWWKHKTDKNAYL